MCTLILLDTKLLNSKIQYWSRVNLLFIQNRVLELAPKSMISSSMGERRQFENWGRPLGGTDFRGLRRWGQSPPLALLLTSRTFYYYYLLGPPRPLPRPHCQLTDFPRIVPSSLRPRSCSITERHGTR